MTRTSGRIASVLASPSPSCSGISSTRSGEKPASVSTSRATSTVMASGSTARGCGLTSTGLPVTRLANSPG